MTEWPYDYTKKRVLGKTIADLFETIWHFWLHRRVMVCDMDGDYDLLQHKEYYVRHSYWTDEKASMLHERGYRNCKNHPDHDNIAWMGVPVMIKLRGFKMVETDEKDGPTFLHDRMRNNLLNKFARSMARASIVSGMDMQKLIMMGIVGVGAIIGMKVLGVF